MRASIYGSKNAAFQPHIIERRKEEDRGALSRAFEACRKAYQAYRRIEADPSDTRAMIAASVELILCAEMVSGDDACTAGITACGERAILSNLRGADLVRKIRDLMDNAAILTWRVDWRDDAYDPPYRQEESR